MPTSTKLPAGCSRGLCALFDSLCAQSVRDYDPAFEFPGWPDELDKKQWFTSPELVSLNGTSAWARLDVEQQQLVSFWDAVNFFSSRGPTRGAYVDALGVRRVDNLIKPDLVAPGNKVLGAAATSNSSTS